MESNEEAEPMWIVVVTGLLLAAGGAAVYVVLSSKKAEMQKYYAAAYKMIKEGCLDNAIKNQGAAGFGGQKLMVYLKWRDGQKQGYVFDPKPGIRVGRTPGDNEICIREAAVSARHCILFVSEGRLAVQDQNSANGTWIVRGIRKCRVNGGEFLYSGDKLIVGTLKIKITVFTFDMAYI